MATDRSPIDWYKKVLSQYADFAGRARRSEYWWFVAVNLGVALAITVVLGILSDTLASLASALYGLAVFVPGLAVSVRRLHDTGRSGWHLLAGLIPLLGAIYLIYVMVQEGDAGDNEYGPDPKQASGAYVV